MIIVTGATGNIGQHVVAELQKAKADFRVMARDPEAARQMLGEVDIVKGDMDDAASLGAAFAGADALFLLCVHGPTMEQRQIRAVEAAKQAGIKRIVKVSGSPNTVTPDCPADTGREHWAIEQAIRNSGLEFAFLRPNFFMQNLLDMPATMVRKGQTLKMPFPHELPISFVDTRDVGECAARCLLSEKPVYDVYEITGAASSLQELTQVL
ncbi:MAG: SDR family oxidoreductase, partial [Nevskiales bacterium]